MNQLEFTFFSVVEGVSSFETVFEFNQPQLCCQDMTLVLSEGKISQKGSEKKKSKLLGKKKSEKMREAQDAKVEQDMLGRKEMGHNGGEDTSGALGDSSR